MISQKEIKTVLTYIDILRRTLRDNVKDQPLRGKVALSLKFEQSVGQSLVELLQSKK